ncbi:MAG: exodeoxyribonuclease III, partial [Nitrosospira sp.]|nr:exodeoxyribonuclease III [Nitrosospira sp.]
MRIITLNLNGVRSAAGKGFFRWLPTQRADIVCVQELKAQAIDITGEMASPGGYHGSFHCAEKKGYSGVGVYS